jgi:CBS domain-containing protein
MYQAFEKTSRNGVGRLVVLNGSSLVGYLSVKDINHVLALGASRAVVSSGPARRHAA